MKDFLEYVAQDIVDKYGSDLSRIAIVFPNKRASLFFNEYLAQITEKPIWCPNYITISELFRSHSSFTIADPIKLICELHKCFLECTKSSETLDHFYNWGQMLLSDFDDIDKSMADARKVFMNVRDIHELDDISYLNEEQIKVLKKFFSNFNEEHNSELKKRFLNLWNRIYDIYKLFNSKLRIERQTYEGALYKQVANDNYVEFKYEQYIFVGFNVLQEVEKKLFKRLKKEGKAVFYWDFDLYYMKNHNMNGHEAGHYISSYLSDFPNELDTNNDDIYNNFNKPKNITCISASTENVQARYVSTWLKEKDRISAGARTAIILCNENLLLPVIYSIPDDVNSINITTGYPLSQTSIASFLSLLISMQINGFIPSSGKYRLKDVNYILQHPYIKYISKNYNMLYNALNQEKKEYYPTPELLCIDKGCTLLFQNINNSGGVSLIESITKWIIDIIKEIASNVKEIKHPLLHESLFRTYTLINRFYSLILSGDLNVDVITYQRLINQVVNTTSIPFHGEPIEGIQIMGVLETRNIDFTNLLILSVNEGNMPKDINDNSFIPYNIRKAHNLTTIDNKIAIYAYYFYRLLQRAKDITVLYNSSTESQTRGELSRFMLQIMVESNHNVINKTLHADSKPMIFEAKEIDKNKTIADLLINRFDKNSERNKERVNSPLLTPTAINQYMRCPKQFYYNYVCGIKDKEEDIIDKIDNRVFGNIFHSASQKIYQNLQTINNGIITHECLKECLDNRKQIEDIVDEAFMEELFKSEKKSRPNYTGLHLINRQVIITYIRKLLKIDMQFTPFQIISLEEDVIADWNISINATSFTTTIGGRVDRLDCITDKFGKRIRVIDYKTGNKNIESLNNIDDIFDTSNISKHIDYYFQSFLYSLIIRSSANTDISHLPVSPALLFIQHASTKDSYDPTLCLSKEPVIDIFDVKKEFEELLSHTINEIFNMSIPFTPTSNNETCTYCPYSLICRL